MKDFNEKIIEIRKALKIGQKEFAEKLGVPQGTLSNYELKKRTPNIDFFLNLLNIGVSPLYLFYDIGQPFDPKFDKFLASYHNEKENEDENLLKHIEDFLIYYLKQVKKIDGNSFKLAIPTSKNIVAEFISTSLKEVTDDDLKGLKVSNSKNIFKNIIRRRKLTATDTEIKRSSILNEIDTGFSDLEVYVLLKYHDKFI